MSWLSAAVRTARLYCVDGVSVQDGSSKSSGAPASGAVNRPSAMLVPDDVRRSYVSSLPLGAATSSASATAPASAGMRTLGSAPRLSGRTVIGVSTCTCSDPLCPGASD